MYRFNLFGGHSQPVQLMYGRTASFKGSVNMYCRIAESYGCMPVQKLCKSRLMSPMFHALFQSIWLPFASCTVDVHTANFKESVHICIVGYLRGMSVRLYNNCTNLHCRHQCFMHCFNLFGGHSHPVQLMYGRTPYFT